MGLGSLAVRYGLPAAVFFAVILAPNPEGLTEQGQRALAVMAVAVVLWAMETLHIAVTGMVAIVALILVHAVDDVNVALYGFSQPVTYFLVGILTLGMAVRQSGLAQRLAAHLIRFAGGSPKLLYVQMLAAFAGLTFALPSASTRGAIMVHIYEQVMEHWGVEKTAPLNKAIMLAMGGLNRLGSTAWRYHPSCGVRANRRFWPDCRFFLDWMVHLDGCAFLPHLDLWWDLRIFHLSVWIHVV